jgi:hypothetical protein
MTDIQKLKALAEAACPRDDWYEQGDLRYADDKTGETHGFNHHDAAFVKRASPAAVLELIAEIERLSSRPLQGELNAAMDLIATYRRVNRELRSERDQLKAENEALRAEAAKWKNESVSDSQTIYSLSCNLAQRTGEVRELAGVVDDLAALTKKFVQRLRKAVPGNDLSEQALGYLKRKGLQGSAMRELVEGRLS